MSGKIKFLVILIQFTTILNTANAQCNTCSAISGIACISETEYVVCDNGVPITDNAPTCPLYAYCNVNTVCANITATPTPSCISSCGVCTPDKRFACVDTNKFQMCYGTTTPTSPVLTCPTGSVCDYNAAAGSFCAPEGDIEPVCLRPYTPKEPELVIPTQPSTGTTLDPWTSWCRNLGLAGRFPYVSDTTCKAYIYCFLNNNLLHGNYYTCVGTSVFNPFYQKCVSPENYECTL